MSKENIQPRLIRMRDAPAYLGMERNGFNRDVRPFVQEIPIGSKSIAFDRLDLDAWVEHHKRRNGRSTASNSNGRMTKWDVKECQGYKSVEKSGKSTRKSSEYDFAKALEQVTLRKQKST